MRQAGEDQSIFTNLAQPGGEAVSGVILKLIGEHVEAPLVELWRTVECGLYDTGDDKGSEQMRIQLAYRSLVQIANEDLSLVHELSEVEGGALAQHPADKGGE